MVELLKWLQNIIILGAICYLAFSMSSLENLKDFRFSVSQNGIEIQSSYYDK